MSKYSTVSITYIPGDDEREIDPTVQAESAEQEIYEDDITGEDVGVATVMAGIKLMKTMGFADFDSNQIAYMGWERYPYSKPGDYWIHRVLIVALFNRKTRSLTTEVRSWDGEKFVEDDEDIVYWTILPDPPMNL